MRKLLVLLFLVPTLSYGDEPAPRTMAETFLNILQKNDVSGAYENLFQGSSIPTDKPQESTMLKQQTETVLSIYGKVLGYELVQEEYFGTSVVRLVYLLKAEKHATVWEFYFYKPKREWFLVNLLFNDEFNLLGSKK